MWFYYVIVWNYRTVNTGLLLVRILLCIALCLSTHNTLSINLAFSYSCNPTIIQQGKNFPACLTPQGWFDGNEWLAVFKVVEDQPLRAPPKFGNRSSTTRSHAKLILQCVARHRSSWSCEWGVYTDFLLQLNLFQGWQNRQLASITSWRSVELAENHRIGHMINDIQMGNIMASLHR